MGEVTTAVVAVVGPLLGSGLTQLVRCRATREMADDAHLLYLRTERMGAYSAFASAVAVCSRAELDRWHRPREDPSDPEDSRLHLVAYERRAEARQALLRVQLIAGDDGIVALAQAALEATKRISKAVDADDSLRLTLECREAAEEFVRVCALQVPSAGDDPRGAAVQR